MGLFHRKKEKPVADQPAFPFADAPDTAVFTCCHVLSGAESVRYASHDEEDGAWQFLCGGRHAETDARIVSLQYMLDIEPALASLAGMPEGAYATRKDAAAPWAVHRPRSK